MVRGLGSQPKGIGLDPQCPPLTRRHPCCQDTRPYPLPGFNDLYLISMALWMKVKMQSQSLESPQNWNIEFIKLQYCCEVDNTAGLLDRKRMLTRQIVFLEWLKWVMCILGQRRADFTCLLGGFTVLMWWVVSGGENTFHAVIRHYTLKHTCALTCTHIHTHRHTHTHTHTHTHQHVHRGARSTTLVTT